MAGCWPGLLDVRVGTKGGGVWEGGLTISGTGEAERFLEGMQPIVLVCLREVEKKVGVGGDDIYRTSFSGMKFCMLYVVNVVYV